MAANDSRGRKKRVISTNVANLFKCVEMKKASGKTGAFFWGLLNAAFRSTGMDSRLADKLVKRNKFFAASFLTTNGWGDLLQTTRTVEREQIKKKNCWTHAFYVYAGEQLGVQV